jgi:hypothetical protein
MRNRHHSRKRRAPSNSASQPFSGSVFSPADADIILILDDPEVMAMAMRAGLLQQMLDASRTTTGPDRFVVSPPLMVDGLYVCIVYFYNCAAPQDNGWLAVQANTLANLLQWTSRLSAEGVEGRIPLKGGQPWN